MDRFRELVSAEVRDYVAVTVITAGGCYGVLKLTGCLYNTFSKWRLNQRWKNTPKDVVIVHRVPAVPSCPNASPFVLKLETYLRMCQIDYQIDSKDGMGPKGKTPWITLNGEHISDSQLCIEFLAKKFEKQIGNYSEKERAIGTAARILLDEHFYWGLILWRYVYSFPKGFGPDKVFDAPKIIFILFGWVIKRWAKRSTFYQGMGRHSEVDVYKMTSDDLRAISLILGNKKFILGDSPCEDDASIFGELAQVMWCMPGSPYEKLLNDELPNLKEYCLRMKEKYWPDWEDCVAKRK